MRLTSYSPGDLVVIPFPYTDLQNWKTRPAVVLGDQGGGDDAVFCMITSQAVNDPFAVKLNNSDLSAGSIRVKSQVRPGKIATLDKRLIRKKIGSLNAAKMAEIHAAICASELLF